MCCLCWGMSVLSATLCGLAPCFRTLQVFSAMASAGTGAPVAKALVTDLVTVIIQKFEQEKLGVVQAADQIEEALRGMGLLYVMEINPRQIGFDPCTRFGR